MKIFNFGKDNKNQTININGYLIDKDSGELIKAPIGLSIYEIPSEVKIISIVGLNSMKQSAIEINFSNNGSIISLPFGAFSGFTKLSKVVLPPNLKKMDTYFDANSLSRGIEIVLPNNLEQFAINQFSPNKVKLELDDTVTTLKSGIVSHNNVLEELIVSGKIQRLEKYCINQVRYLEKVWLREGIIYMDAEAIRGCNNLREIHIPSSLKLFKLGRDDYRPVKEFAFHGKKYEPSSEQIEEEKNRTIKLYKTVNGEEILFEVNRNSFETLRDDPNEFVFEGYGNLYRINKETIRNWKHIVVDITGQKMYNHNENKPTNENFTSFPTSDREKVETTENDLSSLNISSARKEQTNLSKKEMIERLLQFKISNNKRVKDQSLGTFRTVLKTQREMSDEMVSLLEELEDCYNEEKIDVKTYIDYERSLKEIYSILITNAPFETQTIDDFVIGENDKLNQWQLEMMKKYGYDTASEQEQQDFIRKYLETFSSENIENVDPDEMVDRPRKGR